MSSSDAQNTSPAELSMRKNSPAVLVVGRVLKTIKTAGEFLRIDNSVGEVFCASELLTIVVK